MTKLSDAIGKKDELANDRIRDGRNARFVEPTRCPDDVKRFIDEARYWFGRGEHVTDKGTRRRLDVQMLDYRNINGIILAVVQVNKDRIEAWQRFPKRKLVYHLACCQSDSPSAISDAPVLSLTGQRLHWYVRHGYSPMSWLAKNDPALFAKILVGHDGIRVMAEEEIESAVSKEAA